MKHLLPITLSLFTFTFALLPVSAQQKFAKQNSTTQIELGHWGLRPEISSTYRVHHQVDLPDRLILSLGLPKIWSDLEKQNIENAISISVYKNSEFSNVDDVVEFEKARVADISEEFAIIETDSGITYHNRTLQKGLTYLTRANCRYENELGYVVAFTATEGTFDKNLARFEELLDSLEFLPPTDAPDAIKNRSNYQIAREYYQLGPTKAARVIEYLQRQLAETPDHSKALFLLATTQKGIGKLDEAVETIIRAEKVLKENGILSARLAMLKAECFYHQEKYDAAQVILQPMWAFVKDNPKQQAKYDQLMKLIENKLRARKSKR